MKDCLVSVLIPAYNHEKYVQESIRSVIAQTYDNIELIVINDGSEDGTWAKIQEIKSECERRFKQVCFETQENSGVCSTLKRLIDLAQGEYILALASDDLIRPEAVETHLRFLEENSEYAVSVGNSDMIDGEGRVCYWDKKRNIVYDGNKARFLTFRDFLETGVNFSFDSEDFGRYSTLYCKNYIPNGFMYRKSVYDRIGFYTTEAPLEDWWFMLQVSKYWKIKYIDKVLFSYRWHGANTVKDRKRLKELSQMTADYEERILENIGESDVLPDVIEVKRNGICYKKVGIPFIFMIYTWKKGGCKVKIIKFFGIKIFEYAKARRREI